MLWGHGCGSRTTGWKPGPPPPPRLPFFPRLLRVHGQAEVAVLAQAVGEGAAADAEGAGGLAAVELMLAQAFQDGVPLDRIETSGGRNPFRTVTGLRRFAGGGAAGEQHLRPLATSGEGMLAGGETLSGG